MSSQDSKKAKRRKIKKVTKHGQVSAVVLQNEPLKNYPCPSNEDVKEIEKFMDAPYDCDSGPSSLSRGPNPYLGGERCLLCRCERPDPPNADRIREETDDNNRSEDLSTLSTLPLWVCPNCRKTVEEVEKKSLDSLLDQDFPSLPFLPDMNLGPQSPPNDPGILNGSVCTCEACTERRQIEAEHERETQELQKCWMELRKLVWLIYYRNAKPDGGESLSSTEHDLSEPDENRIAELVSRLCNRDPHQLFRRLESQAREFVLEKKVRLLRQLTVGHKTPTEACDFVSKLLEEYAQLCKAAGKLAGLLTELEKVHLKKFNVTWELHNKHLFQSIAYTDPMVQKSLPSLITELRQVSPSKEGLVHGDNYPVLLQRYHKFENEMTVVNVVWRDCQQLIEQYNEEQEAMKVKQKMLKEDWEFFKEQRKLLEQKVLKRSSTNQTSLSSQTLKCTAGLEAQFTETMRHLLQGTKPTPEECHCPTCNRKRCPCDECTITHMITCGIIQPDSADQTATKVPRCIDDVTPPSMSSSTSSSGPSSPLFVDSETLAHFENCQEIRKEAVGNEVDEDDDDDDDDEDDDDDDVSQSDDDDYDDDDDDDDDEENDDSDDGTDDEDSPSQNSDCPITTTPLDFTDQQDLLMSLPPEAVLQNWRDPQVVPLPPTDGQGVVPNSITSCACYHCTSPAEAQQAPPEECQCHICLKQRGKMISTTLPQHIPAATRPELNLYPHIHGHSNHPRPLLQPQLYDLHVPMRQPKPVDTSPKSPLDFDTPEGLQEHMYHAYGEWDNSARMLIGSHKYSSELLPPPPLPTSGPFISEGLMVNGSNFVNPDNRLLPQPVNMVPSSIPFESMSSVVSTAMSQPPAAQTESCQKATVRRAFRNDVNTKHQPFNPGRLKGILPPLSVMPPVSRPATMGGNSHPLDDKPQRCRHNASVPSKLSSTQQQQHNINHAALTSAGHQAHRNPAIDSSRISVPHKDDCKPASIQGANPLHSCNHSHSRNSTAFSHQSGGENQLPHPGACANGGNVSVGTSTICTDPDCETHHDDHYDSIDDSGSEQSSSTSTSNQKEGKYCDCCYCEFFGHSNPPSVPTSKNYPEMRDKLRLLLKRKKEAKQDDDIKELNALYHDQKEKDALEGKALDELVNFINGVDDPKDKQLTAKAAKRARQKQRKAQERARRVEDERLKLRTEKAWKEVTKSCSQAFPCTPSHHCTQNDFIALYNEMHKPHGANTILPEQRKKKKARVKSTAVREENAKSADNKLAPSIEKSSLEVIKCCDVTPEVKSVNRTKNNLELTKVITEKLTIQHSPSVKSREESLKSKQKDKSRSVVGSSVPKLPSSPKNAGKSANNNKSSSPAPTQTSPPLKFTATLNNPEISNGTVRFTATPDKTTFVNPNNLKRGTKKVPSAQVHQNNLNNLNGGLQSPITRNGLVIQSANYQINGQRWTVTPSDPVKSQPALKPTPPQLLHQQLPSVVKTTRSVSSMTKKPTVENGHNSRLPVSEQATHNHEQVQNKLQSSKAKKKNKKNNKNSEDSKHIDEIFMPRSDSDLEGGEMDDFERELEEFKRFCFDPTPKPRQKLQVNVNLKDIFTKKKASLGCS